MVVGDNAIWSRNVASGSALSSANASSRCFMVVSFSRMMRIQQSVRVWERAKHCAHGACVERGQIQRQRDQLVVAGSDVVEYDAFKNRHAVRAIALMRIHRFRFLWIERRRVDDGQLQAV